MFGNLKKNTEPFFSLVKKNLDKPKQKKGKSLPSAPLKMKQKSFCNIVF
jgi:hypothetical protein